MYRFVWEQVKENGITLAGSEDVAAFPDLVALEEDGSCRFAGPIKVELRVFPVDGMLEVEGNLSCRVVLPCSRCLVDIEQDLACHLQLTLVRELPKVEAEDGEEIELSAEEMGMLQVEHDEVDLHQAIAEQLLLEIPWHPLCSNKCAGLCPSCGANLNNGSCGCHPETGFNKFAALKDFKVEK